MKNIFFLFIISITISLLSPKLWGQPGNLYVRHWYCCLDGNLFKTENLTAKNREKMGRRQDVLCPDCQKKFGDLAKEYQRRYQWNQTLLARYRLKHQDAILANEKMVDAMTETFGQDASYDSLTVSGLSSKAGKFTTAFASLVTNFESGGLIPKLTKYTANGLSIYQSNSGAEIFGNVSSTFIDVLEEQAINAMFIPGNPLSGPGKQLYNDFKAGKSLDAAVANFNKTLSNLRNIERAKMVLKGAGIVNIAADIYGLYDATTEFFSGLSDVIDNYNIREMNERDRLKLMDQIAGNSDTMACIKSTLDYQNGGGNSLMRKFPIPATSLAYLSNILLHIYQNSETHLINPFSENVPFLEVDINKISAIQKELQQLNGHLQAQMNNFLFEMVPPLIPWILEKWTELKPTTLYQLLKRLKPALDAALKNFKKIERSKSAVDYNISNIVTGYEVNYTNGGPDIISAVQKFGTNDLDQKWLQKSNDKIKNDLGRVIMKFPPNSEWSIGFYNVEGKYITNRSSYSKHEPLYDIAPGTYTISLNHVPINNVPVEKGKEVVLRFGFLKLSTNTSWQLYNASKEKQLTSGKRPVTLPIPVGKYVLFFEGRDYFITIKDKMILKFEPPLFLE